MKKKTRPGATVGSDLKRARLMFRKTGKMDAGLQLAGLPRRVPANDAQHRPPPRAPLHQSPLPKLPELHHEQPVDRIGTCYTY
jgi:hypothetical protein